MEDLKTLFTGRTKIPGALKTPHTIIFFKPKQLPELKEAVRKALGFEKGKLYYKGFIPFSINTLAVLRQYGLKHRHAGALRVNKHITASQVKLKL